MIKPGEKTKFFFRNLFKGLAWFAVLVAVFILTRKYVDPEYEKLLEPIFNNTFLIFSIYFASEVIIGIIAQTVYDLGFAGNLTDYAMILLLFAVLSYLAGFIAYLFRKYLSSTIIFRFLRRKYLIRYQSLFVKYGAFLILVAALTPVPYSAITCWWGRFIIR